MPLNLAGLDALLEPRSIAVYGASSDPAKIGGRPIDYLRRNRYAGDIYPINPHIQGLSTYAPPLA